MLGYGLVLYDALYSWTRRAGCVPAPVSKRRIIWAPAFMSAWSERRQQRQSLSELGSWLLHDLGIMHTEAAAEGRS